MTVKSFRYSHEKNCGGQLSEKPVKPHSKAKPKQQAKPKQVPKPPPEVYYSSSDDDDDDEPQQPLIKKRGNQNNNNQPIMRYNKFICFTSTTTNATETR